MRFITLFIVLILLSNCKKEDKFKDVKIFGHAGDGLDMSTAPYQENTLEAIEYTLSYPEVAGVEIDIQWSKDGTAWLFHDENLDSQTNGSGCVRSKTDSELESIHYQGVQKEKLPKLNEIATLVSNRKVILDLKSYGGCGVELSNQERQAALIEFNSLLTNTEVYAIVQDLTDVNFYNNLGWKTILEVYNKDSYFAVVNWQNSSGCTLRNESITSDEIHNIQSKGKEVILFNIKSPKAIKKSLKKGPDIILSDDIKATLIQKIR